MNSRGSVNEIVNFSTDLATLNQLNVKEPLLSFPFDHLYACHSDSGNQSQTLELDKEVEISTHCVVAEDSRATQRLATLENQNKKLKNLLLYHLDLIQQQNDFMTKREKVYQALKLENDTLKSKVTQAERKLPSPKQIHMPSIHGPTSTITSGALSGNVASTSSQNYFDTFNEILLPKDVTNQYNSYSTDITNAKYSGDVFDLLKSSDTDLSNYFTSDLGRPSVLEGTTLQNSSVKSPSLPCDTYTVVEKSVDVMKEPKYTVTTSIGNQKIHCTRKRSSGVGSLSRMPKKPKDEPSPVYNIQDTYNTNNKKSKVNMTAATCNKTEPSKYNVLPYSALCTKMRLVDPTPPGEDPYQIGEAEMRAQSPIPKLMLQKNHGRARNCPNTRSQTTSTITPSTSGEKVYDTESNSGWKRPMLGPSEDKGMVSLRAKKKPVPNIVLDEPEVDVVNDVDIDWSMFASEKKHSQPSLCDFSYGETSSNLLNKPIDISKLSFNEIFEPSPVNTDDASTTAAQPEPEKSAQEKTKKRRTRTKSLAGPIVKANTAETKRGNAKRGRKRAKSTTAAPKRETAQKAPAKPRTRRATRTKQTPVLGMTTRSHYHTSMGDPDLTWYLGLDPDIKKEDCNITNNTASNVEVPSWRVKVYSPRSDAEGTENLDDKVFEKRHQKYEAEERRQLRWHMRRIREQRHVERLRQRQRDPWGATSTQVQTTPADYTMWPQPIRDLQYIEITDTLPVTAFGEEIPDLPKSAFKIPWVRSSRPQRRSKRSKTLH